MCCSGQDPASHCCLHRGTSDIVLLPTPARQRQSQHSQTDVWFQTNAPAFSLREMHGTHQNHKSLISMQLCLIIISLHELYYPDSAGVRHSTVIRTEETNFDESAVMKYSSCSFEKILVWFNSSVTTTSGLPQHCHLGWEEQKESLKIVWFMSSTTKLWSCPKLVNSGLQLAPNQNVSWGKARTLILK